MTFLNDIIKGYTGQKAWTKRMIATNDFSLGNVGLFSLTPEEITRARLTGMRLYDIFHPKRNDCVAAMRRDYFTLRFAGVEIPKGPSAVSPIPMIMPVELRRRAAERLNDGTVPKADLNAYRITDQHLLSSGILYRHRHEYGSKPSEPSDEDIKFPSTIDNLVN